MFPFFLNLLILIQTYLIDIKQITSKYQKKYLHYKESGLSKNKFCQKAEIQRSQLNGYINNTITRLDTEVLVRICHTLNYSISDLLEYIPPDEKIENTV